jgi:predicted NodU family carbamoyl transferase
MHDSSACIVRDGELLFAVAEERLSRVKHDARFPELAIQACLKFASARANELDEVCFGWQTAGPLYRHDLKLYATGGWPITYLNVLNSTRHFLSMWHQKSGVVLFARRFGPTRARMRFVDHHLAHAISAFAYSGFPEAAVVVMDGRGAWEATSLWRGANGIIEHGLTIPFPDSVGLFYSTFTAYLGFVPNSDEWKVMGLAPYGQPGVKLDAFIDSEAAPYRRATARRTAGGRERDRAAAQRHRIRSAGTMRAGDVECGADGRRENTQPEFVPGWRSGPELEGEWQDSSVRPGGQDFCATRRRR